MYTLSLGILFVLVSLASALPWIEPVENDIGLSYDDPCKLGQEVCLKAHSWENENPWECVSTFIDAKNCGGCLLPYSDYQDVGRDCTIIPGQREVECVTGECVVKRCHAGWQLSRTMDACHELYDEGD